MHGTLSMISAHGMLETHGMLGTHATHGILAPTCGTHGTSVNATRYKAKSRTTKVPALMYVPQALNAHMPGRSTGHACTHARYLAWMQAGHM